MRVTTLENYNLIIVNDIEILTSWWFNSRFWQSNLTKETNRLELAFTITQVLQAKIKCSNKRTKKVLNVAATILHYCLILISSVGNEKVRPFFKKMAWKFSAKAYRSNLISGLWINKMSFSFLRNLLHFFFYMMFSSLFHHYQWLDFELYIVAFHSSFVTWHFWFTLNILLFRGTYTSSISVTVKDLSS